MCASHISGVVIYAYVSDSLVLTTLNEALGKDPDRKCFRLIGGVLAERTVKDVVPQLQTNCDNVRYQLMRTEI